MRTSRAILVTSCVLLAAAWARGGDSDDLTLLAMAPTGDLAKEFASPPGAARPWVYWFWLGGNINREGITADLEAMKRAGIGGVLIMEVDQGAPAGPVPFGSPAWRELFRFVCSEAQRLGLEVNMTNDAGWCGSGGPWITPELSMQKVVWTQTRVEGPRRFGAILPQPQAVKDFYRDIAVLAVPQPAGDEVELSALAPKVTTSDGQAVDAKTLFDRNTPTAMTLPRPDAGKPQYVQFELKEPMTARSLSLTIQGGAGDITTRGALQVSQDGRTFRTVCEFAGPPGVVTLDFPEVSSRFFRILFTEETSWLDRLGVGQVEIASGYRLEGFQGKAAFVTQYLVAPARWPAARPGVAVPRGQIVDLTAAMDRNGRVTWDVPAGKWLLLRLGHTSTGVENHPAPLGGLGLETDKLSKEATEAHFNGLMGKLIAEAGPLAGQGKTLVATHIDSWETGSQNWTPRMREEFRKRRGYDLLPLLPVLTGRLVDSREVSERFLWDLRQTVSDMVVENYAGHMRRLAARHGLRLSIEAYGDVPCDEMTYAGAADEPMAEFWSWEKYSAGFSCTEMSSAAHTYGKRILGAESCTANNHEMWQGYPAAVKDLGDWALCEGINRFVFHRYAIQPWPDRRPGMSMGPWGLHYERTETWWDYLQPWHEYLARCQYLLRQGQFVADVCYLQPEGAPRRFTPYDSDSGVPEVVSPKVDVSIAMDRRPGYNFDGCTPEVVLTRMTVRDGRIVLPDGMSYRVLVLPAVESMTPALLGKIKELVEAGATVVAPSRPENSPSLADYPRCDAQVQKLAEELWANPRVVKGMSARQWLGGQGVPPDFQAGRPLRYIHRRLTDADVYFVANGGREGFQTVCSFRVSGKQPELWHPETGRITPLPAYDEKQGCTRVPLCFGPIESVFVVFRRPAAAADRVVSVTRDGQELLGRVSRGPQPGGDLPACDLLRREVSQPGAYVVRTAAGQRQFNVSLPAPLPVAGPWEVQFPTGWGAPERITLPRLISWTAHADAGVRYFSGTATYRTSFDVPAEMLDRGRRWYLDLGRVEVMAAVNLNGQSLGTLWKPPFRIDATAAVKPGANSLEVKVVNLWINRMIGDEQLAEDSDRNPDGTLKKWPAWLEQGKPSPTGRFTFTTWRLYKKGDPLVESGLLGPVLLRPAEAVETQAAGR